MLTVFLCTKSRTVQFRMLSFISSLLFSKDMYIKVYMYLCIMTLLHFFITYKADPGDLQNRTTNGSEFTPRHKTSNANRALSRNKVVPLIRKLLNYIQLIIHIAFNLRFTCNYNRVNIVLLRHMMYNVSSHHRYTF